MFLVVTQKVVLKENVIKSANKKLFLEFLQCARLCLGNTVGYIQKECVIHNWGKFTACLRKTRYMHILLIMVTASCEN